VFGRAIGRDENAAGGHFGGIPSIPSRHRDALQHRVRSQTVNFPNLATTQTRVLGHRGLGARVTFLGEDEANNASKGSGSNRDADGEEKEFVVVGETVVERGVSGVAVGGRAEIRYAGIRGSLRRRGLRPIDPGPVREIVVAHSAKPQLLFSAASSLPVYFIF